MRAAATVLIALVAVAPARADEAVIRGRVLDRATSQGVAGALLTADALSTETAADGSFALPAAAAAAEVFVFADGYAPVQALRLTVTGSNRIELHRDREAVEIIEVTGRPPDTASPTAYTLGRDQIRALPGSGNDVLRALQSLPGVSRMSYGIGGLVLRGASPHESSVFLDGIEVPLAFHFGGVTSFYPSSLLDQVVLRPGGADVAFGRGIGGVVELRGRAPRADRLRMGGEVGVFDASAYAEAPLGGGGVALGVRRSYADAFLGALLPDDRTVLPRYYDGQLRWERAVAGGTLKLLGFFSDDRIVGWGGTDFRQGFARGAVRYERAYGPTTLTITPWGGWGRTEVEYVLEHTETRPDLAQTMRLDRHPVGLRADLRRDTGWGHVAGGLDVQGAYVRYLQSADILFGAEEAVVDTGTYLDAGAWLEARWRIEDGKLTLKPGFRVDRHGVSEAVVLEPRVAATHELTSWLTMRETFGFHHQPPGPVAAVADDTERTNTIDIQDPHGQVVQGVHTSVGARVVLPASVIAAVTAYHVARRGPSDPDGSAGEAPGAPLPFSLGIVLDNLIGEEFGGIRRDRGRGFGTEVSVQRRTERWLLWLSYTLAVAQTHANGPSRTGWVTNDLDQTHNLNVVASVRVGGWQLGTRLRYTTGLPYTPRLAATIDEDGREEVIHGRGNSARLASFVSLDLRVDRTWPRAWGTLGGFLDLQNVTNSRNPEGVDFDEGSIVPRPRRGLPILPMIGFSYQPPD